MSQLCRFASGRNQGEHVGYISISYLVRLISKFFEDDASKLKWLCLLHFEYEAKLALIDEEFAEIFDWKPSKDYKNPDSVPVIN